MDTFYLQIDLGNEAMQTPHDVAVTLRRVVDKLCLRDGWPSITPQGPMNMPIRDLDGNTVGEWSVVGE